jgi:site-specific DNA-cytosine methylase
VGPFKLPARLNSEAYAFFLNEEVPGLWNSFKDYVYQEPIDTLEELDDKSHEAIVIITHVRI